MKTKKILERLERLLLIDPCECDKGERLDVIIGRIDDIRNHNRTMQEGVTKEVNAKVKAEADLNEAQAAIRALMSDKKELEKKLATKNEDDTRELREAREDAECCRKRVDDVKRQVYSKESELGEIIKICKNHGTFSTMHPDSSLATKREEQPVAWMVYDLYQRLVMAEGKLKFCQEANKNIQENYNRLLAEMEPDPVLTNNQTEIIVGIENATDAAVLRKSAKELAKKLFYLEGRYKAMAEAKKWTPQ